MSEKYKETSLGGLATTVRIPLTSPAWYVKSIMKPLLRVVISTYHIITCIVNIANFPARYPSLDGFFLAPHPSRTVHCSPAILFLQFRMIYPLNHRRTASLPQILFRI
jgi:hypothetical protein